MGWLATVTWLWSVGRTGRTQARSAKSKPKEATRDGGPNRFDGFRELVRFRVRPAAAPHKNLKVVR